MNRFEQELENHLDKLRAAGLHRELRRVDSPQGPSLVSGYLVVRDDDPGMGGPAGMDDPSMG